MQSLQRTLQFSKIYARRNNITDDPRQPWPSKPLYSTHKKENTPSDSVQCGLCNRLTPPLWYHCPPTGHILAKPPKMYKNSYGPSQMTCYKNCLKSVFELSKSGRGEIWDHLNKFFVRVSGPPPPLWEGGRRPPALTPETPTKIVFKLSQMSRKLCLKGPRCPATIFWQFEDNCWTIFLACHFGKALKHFLCNFSGFCQYMAYRETVVS